ncbi:hypothetical protein [Streptomyces sp.]|uniref:hypothetical protein n=1 Tax=Streptomyces sp. TaxID=1931 RepID=UPI002D569EF2|nr:hypothetical protein [Streptomyces sp.]HZF91873.1 hypothetical protein [Streptomyces sp.]
MANNLRNFEQKIGLGRGSVNVSDEYRSVHFAPPGYRRSRTVTHIDFRTGNPLRSAPTPSGNSTYVRNIGHRVRERSRLRKEPTPHAPNRALSRREPFPNPTAWTPDLDALEVQAVFRVGKPPVHAMTSGKGRFLDITSRQLGRLAAVGAGAPVLPGLLPPSRAAAGVPPAGTWGDQGDGTYVNPILPGDFSDWDCIRRTLGGAVDDVTRTGPELNRNRMNSLGRRQGQPVLLQPRRKRLSLVRRHLPAHLGRTPR